MAGQLPADFYAALSKLRHSKLIEFATTMYYTFNLINYELLHQRSKSKGVIGVVVIVSSWESFPTESYTGTEGSFALWESL